MTARDSVSLWRKSPCGNVNCTSVAEGEVILIKLLGTNKDEEHLIKKTCVGTVTQTVAEWATRVHKDQRFLLVKSLLGNECVDSDNGGFVKSCLHSMGEMLCIHWNLDPKELTSKSMGAEKKTDEMKDITSEKES